VEKPAKTLAASKTTEVVTLSDTKTVTAQAGIVGERVFTASDGRRYRAAFSSERELNLFDKMCREISSAVSVNLKDSVVECRPRGYTMRITIRASSLEVLD